MNKVVLALCALPFLASLGGCQTVSPEVRQANNKAACDGYGFKPNTNAYAACMMNMDQSAKEDDYRRRQILANGLREMGQSMQRNRPVTCNTFGNVQRGGFGSSYGNATTTCY